MLVLFIISLITGLSYLFLILFFLKGWNNTDIIQNSENQGTAKVSVIIAVRDEAINIPGLTRALIMQDYSKDLLEIIFVDDHSTDSTKEIIQLCMKGESHYSIVDSRGKGKKEALITGYQAADGDLIITTDADCIFGQKWISTIVYFYEKYDPEFIIGPVILDEGPGIFQDLQALEFLSLTGTSGGSAGIGKPVLCNGANLAFNRKIIVPDHHTMNPQFASGDDIFLLHKAKKIPERKPQFLKSHEALVTSRSQFNLKSFWNQRIRWTSKSIGYRDCETIITALVVYITNLLLLVSIILSVFNSRYILLFLGLILLKSVPDFLFMSSVTKFFRKKYLLRYFLILQFLYFFYVSIIPFAGMFGKYSWKNRLYSSGRGT